MSIAVLSDVNSGSEEQGAIAAGLASCSVVISTRDRLETLVGCLQSVREQRHPGLEVVVVDSAPRLADSREVAEQFGAQYVRVERAGLSRARNCGARSAQGEVVVFLDDDLTLEPGCIAALVKEFADPRVMAAGGRIIMVGGDAAARGAFEAFGGFDPGPERRVVDRETPRWFELVNFGGLGSGAMLAVRRSAFDAWPGFDERLGRGAPLDGGEELLAYFSLVDHGHRVVYSPGAVAKHPAPLSLPELRKRVVSGAAVGSAYLALLLVEHPQFRSDALKYASEALRGKRRDWRPRPAAARNVVAPRWRVQLAWASGPLLYALMRFRVFAATATGSDPRRRTPGTTGV